MIVCPNCGEENLPNARFCVNCGSPLTPAGERAEERRLVTIVFAELVGLRKATGEFDPEDLKRVLEPYHARVARIVANHGGTVDKFGSENDARPELERPRVVFADLAAAPFLAEIVALLGRRAPAPA